MKRLIAPGIAALLVLAVLLALGTWQVERLAWKEGLIAAADARATAAPVDLPPPADWAALVPEAYQYSRVRLAGTFRNDAEFHVFTTLTRPKGPLGGQGYWVVVPLERADGTIVFVNRGFVPLDRKDPATRPEGLLAGAQEFEGLMRPPEGRDRFTADDDVEKNVWLRRDPARFAARLGLDPARVAPFFVDAVESPPGGLPQAGETRLSFVNNHLQYVVTWYGLAATLVVVFVLFARKRLKGE